MNKRKSLLRPGTFAVCALMATALLFMMRTASFAQTLPKALRLNTGQEIWQAACVACHGADGRGMPQSISAFQKPDSFPDFTRCDQTTAETDTQYKATITYGGPHNGFSQIMPAFGEALTQQQIDQVIKYLRGFCRQKGWPRGELNLPLALVTEKAYPEDEVVLLSSVNSDGSGASTHVIYEQRFGKKNQIEVDVPFEFAKEHSTWYGGVGDATLGVKRVLFSNLDWGSILGLFGGVNVPTGNKTRGFGSGVTTFEMFTSYDQLFRTNTFIETQFGALLPHNTAVAPQSIFFSSAIGQMIAPQHGLGRLWSPMMEFVSTHDLVDSAKTDWDVIPQMQVTLSRRQHVRANVGVRVPFTNTAGRSTAVMFYVLWDWQDGKLAEGW
jgi:mono/diheme cytochrome c family protein